VIEHIAVFQMKKEFDEIQEKDMLDHLYTLQYQLRGILSVSLGMRMHKEVFHNASFLLFHSLMQNVV
jgi:hypothetical protein